MFCIGRAAQRLDSSGPHMSFSRHMQLESDPMPSPTLELLRVVCPQRHQPTDDEIRYDTIRTVYSPRLGIEMRATPPVMTAEHTQRWLKMHIGRHWMSQRSRFAAAALQLRRLDDR
ncbi:hypothetical protein JDV02_002298 [Purpureocillium takamizusanense]|uniref:Uncharacterized protein n=1 Tax=Purpureocillium takamizusanense TaxID=2060973 RepID=A0A9Q8V7K4_9HYPO|nr:uncharacterized protein JDV02_002298 [Purpureocillium takamizusanense]UNI15798.1 hypothetical protein JDV02_002298 [Purpureocillium takamizusanense]